MLQKIPWLLPNTTRIQKIFGVLMIMTAVGIFYNVDRKFQTYILDTFPQYGTGLTKIEDNQAVKEQLDKVFQSGQGKSTSGKPMNEVTTQKGPKAPELIPGGEWFNTKPLTMKELEGKVVLVDFWTYSCINCQRTMPYLRDWHAKYKDKGLVLLGVHSPEFAFEKDANNVAEALKDFKLSYPVVQDNDFATWKAYENRYWPAKYLIDKDGIIRYTHFGEGAYAETEKFIQELLKETGQDVSMQINTQEQKIAYNEITHETYLGSLRMEYLVGTGKVDIGQQNFVLEKNIPNNQFSFGGNWTIQTEHSKAGSNAVLAINFTAEKVFLVMNPGQTPGNVQVYLDGKVIDVKYAGKDVKNGYVTIDKDRLYELIDLKGKTENHLLRLEFQTPGIEAFAFTFG